MAIYVASNTAVATITTTLALVAPTSVLAGDLMIATIISHNNTAPSGFDARWVTAYDANNTVAMRFSTLWMLAGPNDAGATFNFTVAGTTVSFGSISVYRGFKGVGNTSSSANASSATVTWATVTNLIANSWIVAVFGYDKNGVSDGGISAGTPTFTNRVLATTATGNTESLGTYDGVDLVVGATGGRTMATGAVAAVNSAVFLELLLQDAPGGGGAFGSLFGSDFGRNGAVQDLTRASPRGLAS